MSASPQSPQRLPKEIKRLDETVVNRIAAGEVVQRPANAVKELIENSLDAGATSITVTAKDGGIKSLQVQDNGCGIRKEDLGILCERHTTSKLHAFEDLASIGTLGFRGEALASISYVSHVTVTTMTAVQGSTHGWKATYRDGRMDPHTPKPAAATQGTVILAEDLFYNVPLRRKALKSASEEYSAILDVVGRYAVYRAGAAMAVKKAGEAKADLATQAGGSRQDAIRAVYGATVAKNVVPLSVSCGGGYPPADKQRQAAEGANEISLSDTAGPSSHNAPSDAIKCSIEGFITGADYAGRKTHLVLFINGRSVEFPPLKRCLEATYAAILPKAAKPFAFFEVRLPPGDVDVNIHPTKKEVAFLHQEELVEAVRDAVEAALLSSNAQRTFKQALLPGAAPPPPPPTDLAPPPNAPGVYRPNKLVRTDARAQTLHAFTQPLSSFQAGSGGGATAPAPAAAGDQAMEDPADLAAHPIEQRIVERGAPNGAAALDLTSVPLRRRRRDGGAAGGGGPSSDPFLPTAMEIATAGNGAAPSCGGSGAQQQQQQLQAAVRHRANPSQSAGLESVERLLAAAERAPHAGVANLLKSATFVGLADSHRCLVQSGTRLYLLDLATLTEDMFYQQVLRRFGSAPRVPLHPPAPAADLALLALEIEAAAGRWADSPQGGTKEEVAELLGDLIKKKAELLSDCFSVGVDADGRITAVPALIEQYHPPAQHLPEFVLALGQSVEWQEEGGCFEGLARALANLYAVRADPQVDAFLSSDNIKGSDEGGEGAGNGSTLAGAAAAEYELRRREWEAQHVLLPALRLFLRPSAERGSDGSVVELTRLEHLYRVFERC